MAPKIEISKSSIPIVWIDTSIILKMCILQSSPEQLDKIQRPIIKRLYDLIYKYGRAGKIICPLADQEGEVWIKREEWMDTIRDLSLGIECISEKEIQDNQMAKAMRAYATNAPLIELSYLDAFHDDPVDELMDTLKERIFVTTNYDIVLGSDYRRKINKEILDRLNIQRVKNVTAGISFETQLKSEFTGSISAVIEMAKAFANQEIQNEEDSYNCFWATINLQGQLKTWEYICGKANDLGGLIGFYKSDYYARCPYANLTCNLYAKIMIDPQPIRTGDPMDITHISTLMPFSDLFITDKAWSAFLKRKSFDKLYNSTVCYIGDSSAIESFFKRIDENIC
jgi:hypothetical protein